MTSQHEWTNWLPSHTILMLVVHRDAHQERQYFQCTSCSSPRPDSSNTPTLISSTSNLAIGSLIGKLKIVRSSTTFAPWLDNSAVPPPLGAGSFPSRKVMPSRRS